jgi:tRNA-2-methylthio-N6-dimethylallyladenosine synthase
MKGLFIQTYGCQMNSSDSDRMRAVLAPLGYESVPDPKLADLVLINTCSIRDKAEAKTHSFAHDLKFLKKERPDLKIGVTGCVAQQEKDQLLKDLPFLDMVVGPDNIDDLPWLIDQSSAIVRADFDETDADRVWKTQTKVLSPGATAFINVMKGCDHFCAYCVVPFTRGREKSRPIADIVADVNDLVSKGVREVTFLGQNINTFGKKVGESLEELFYRVHDIDKLKRIRFTTSHPGDLKDELIECFTKLPKLASSFHLPFQSGSNRILRAMRRFYTVEQYEERVRALRQARPDIAFSTDVIVGFPGESAEDFEQTIELAERVRFDNAYSFLYSPRPGTSAYGRSDSTPETLKIERLMRLQTILRAQSRELHEAEVGKIKEVLIEGPSKKDPSRLTGRTSQNVPVHIEKTAGLEQGWMGPVEIEAATLTHLRGRPSLPNHPRAVVAMPTPQVPTPASTAR